jgi:anti-sigma factor RsiW
MEPGTIHELSAAYALDALDPAEEREFEQHLRSCDQCREDVASFEAAAAALAFGVESPEPPAALRGRILESVREERSNVVVPFRRRRLSFQLVSGLAAVAAAVAIGVGIWAVSLSSDLDSSRAALAVLGDPSAKSIDLQGAEGRLVVSPDGRAALVMRNLDPAPEGQTYQAWVIEGKTPTPAGLFDGDDRRDVVLLDEKVPANAVVAVTVEQDGGVDAPTQKPFILAQA